MDSERYLSRVNTILDNSRRLLFMFRIILSLNLLIGFNLHSQLIANPKDTFDYVFRGRWDNYVVIKNGLYGVIDTNYHLIVKPEYDFISHSWNEGFRVKKNNLWGILNKNGQLIIPIQYEQVGPTKSKAYCARQNGKWGLLDSLNHWLIPAVMDSKIYMFQEGIVKKNGKYGVMSRKGEVVIPIIYSKAINYEDPLTYRFKNGFFSRPLNYKLKDEHDSIIYKRFKSIEREINYRIYEENNLYGLKDKNHNIIVKPQYRTFLNFSEGLAFVIGDSFQGYIDTNGNQLIRLEKQYYGRSFQNGSASFSLTPGLKNNFNSKWGSINRQGKIIIEPKYDWLSKYSNGRYRASQDSSILILDSNGHFIREYMVDKLMNYQMLKYKINNNWIYVENELQFYNKGKMGFINNQGEEITGMKYDLVYRYDGKNDLLIVKKDSLYGLINTNGKSILPIEYNSINHRRWQSDDLILKRGGKFGLFNVDDYSTIKCEYDDLRWETEGLMAASKNGKWGFINKKGEIIIPLEYVKVTNFYENESKVSKGDKKFKINRLNQVLP
jgi:hypothetical protein